LAQIFWDTNLFIYLFEQNPAFGDKVRELRRRMLLRGDHLITSALTVGEVLTRPVRDADEGAIRRYRAVFAHPGIRIAPFDFSAAECYARIRQDRNLRPPDAIQLACAAAAGVDLFITNDERLSRKNVAGISFITGLTSAPI